MKSSLKYVVLILTLISLYGFIRIYNSYSQQMFILSDQNSDSWNNRSWEFIENMEVDFPNLTATALPIKTVQAQYYLYNDSINKGMKLLDEVIKDKTNPFIMLQEGLKAKYFNTLGQKDSAYYYSRKAFSGIPRNPLHLAELIRSLNSEKKKDSINEYFKMIQYPFDSQIWRIYLASTIDDYENVYALDVAKEAIERSQNQDPKNNLLRLTSYMKLYGKETLDDALRYEQEALSYLNQNKYQEAISLYARLKLIIPTNYIYKENIAIALFNIKDFAGTILNLEEVEQEGHFLDASQIFMLGISLYNENKISKGCERLFEAEKMGYLEAKNAISILCTTSLTE
jgi:tetratricopeptide (TPR) repeat protein